MTKSVFLRARFWFAGPLAFILSIVMMLGMAVWFPKGNAEIDNIVMPLILFPLIWSGVFFFAYLSGSIKKVALWFLLLFLAHVGLLAWHFSGG